MANWQFHDPLFLLLILLAPIVYLLASRRATSVQYSSLRMLDRAPSTLRGRLSRLPAILLSAAVAVLAIALARPRTPDAEAKISREGIAIVMVVDRSGSMNARDLVQDDRSVDRLEVVKQVFRQFVLGGGDAGGGRPDDMIGLVAFARYADSLCPLTLDHGNLAAMVDDLQIVVREEEDGTAIGDALALAVERLRRHKARSKVVILLTDGENNTGAIDPISAAELAASQNIKVYAIGAGTNGVAPFPVPNLFTGRPVLRPMLVQIDEQTLRKITDKTGGRYYRATDSETLTQVCREIDQLERTKITEFRYLQYTEHYVSFATAALAMIGLSVVAGGTVFRQMP
jgi:Ca-activated chloride channel family protein